MPALSDLPRAAVLTGLTLLLLHGEYLHEGGPVLILSDERAWGIDRGDIPMAGWVMGMVALTALVLDRPATDGRPARRAHDESHEVTRVR